MCRARSASAKQKIDIVHALLCLGENNNNNNSNDIAMCDVYTFFFTGRTLVAAAAAFFFIYFNINMCSVSVLDGDSTV